MTSRPIYLTIFALLAAAAAVVFLAISIDSGIYAPGAHDGGRQARVLDSISKHVPTRFQHDLTPTIVLRKTYSVIAFALVGFFTAPLLPRPRRIAGCALLITGFSLTIEIVQRLTVSHEGNLSSAFDLACGSLGGIFGAIGWNLISHGLTRNRAA